MPQNNQTLLEKTVADQWQTLPSGLTVLVRSMPGYSSTHVIYATKFGSIDRDFCLNGQTVHLPAGVAHFLEHKMFEDEDGDAFAKYAKTGANANAFTSFDRTCYLFTATQQLDESLDVLLGMVGHPYFTEQTIAKEQGIIGQEIKMYDDSPDWRLITGLFECLYHSHPIRSDIAGTVESIAEITPAMLYDSCKAFYAPGNMVLAAAGNTTMEQILAACKRHGLMEPRPAQKVQRLWATEPMTLAATEKTLTMPVSKPCFGVGFKEEPLSADDLRTEALYDLVLSCIVGGMSPLYRRLYDEGLVNPGFGGEVLRVEGCCSVRELNAADLRRRKIDFIISTVPLELDYPAVCISPSLLEPDRAVLKDAITRYSQNRAEPEPAVQPVQDAPHAGSELEYYARLTRSMTGLLEHLTIQPVKVPGSRAALIHAAAQLFCPQEADARLVEQQLRRRETLGDTYIKPLYALLLHCRTSAVKDCRLGYLQAQPPVYEPGRIVLGALVLLAPDDGNGVPVEVMQNVSGQLIETPRLMEALRTSVCIRM